VVVGEAGAREVKMGRRKRVRESWLKVVWSQEAW
jgi:hypothetical protein